ncbi:MAG: DUF5723 family protein [Bacteroidota bacterium]
MKTVELKRFIAAMMILLSLEVVMTTTSFAGGDKYSPRLVGMGRAFTAFSRGLDAVGVNPANLALTDRDATVTINLTPVGILFGSDLINLKVYNDYFTGIPNPAGGDNLPKFLTEQDKNDLLAQLGDGLTKTQTKAEYAPVGISFQIGSFGLAIVPSASVAVNLDLDKAYFEFPLKGYGAGQSYNFDGTAVNGQALLESNVSLAYMLPFELPMVSDIAVGVGAKYIMGLAFVATDHYKGSITPVTQTFPGGVVVNDSITANFDFLQWEAHADQDNMKPAGTGVGLDFGVSMRILEHIQFGASVTDLGKIKWDKNTRAIIGKASLTIGDVANKDNQQKLKDAFKGRTVDTTGFEFDLPTAVHVGAAVQLDDVLEFMPFRWLVAVDGHFGLNNIGGNTKDPQYSIGTELDPLAGWLPLRTGVIIGGREGFGWSAGFGIHLANTFDIDFATQSIAIVTNPETFHTGSFTMGMRLRF